MQSSNAPGTLQCSLRAHWQIPHITNRASDTAKAFSFRNLLVVIQLCGKASANVKISGGRMVRTRCDIIFNDPTSPFYLKQVNGMDQMMRNHEKPLSVHQKKTNKNQKNKKRRSKDFDYHERVVHLSHGMRLIIHPGLDLL